MITAVCLLFFSLATIHATAFGYQTAMGGKMPFLSRFPLIKEDNMPRAKHLVRVKWFHDFSISLYIYLWINSWLFRKKRVMLDEKFQRKASKFAIFYMCKNPKLLFPFFILCYFIFSPNECPGLCQHRPGHSLGKK